MALLRDVGECALSIAPPFDIVRTRDGRLLFSHRDGQVLRARFEPEAIRFPQLELTLQESSIDLLPAGEGAVSLVSGESMRSYRGRLRLVRRSAKSGMVLNVVDLEDYLRGVVTVEMPGDFEPAALRAQAIAARTFAWYQKLCYGPGRDWDVNDNESSQAYGGLEAERRSAAGVQAVLDTRGIVCTWRSPEGERIFPAYYSSTCGGATRHAPRRGEREWTVLAGDVPCDYCAASPLYRWPPVAVPRRTITERLRERYARIAAIGPIAAVEITQRNALNRPVWITVSDASGRSVPLDVDDFRLTVDPTGRLLKSSFCTPAVQGSQVTFSDGRGFGHGYGMCQYGANGLALAGRNSIEILQFYYPGSLVFRAY